MRRFISLVFIPVLIFIAFQCEAFAGSITWNKNIDIGISRFNSIAQNDTGLLAAVGEDGVIKTSKDGIIWTGINSGTTECLNSIVWSQGMFIVVGEGVILTSYDGAKWQISSSVPLNSITWAENKFIAVGKFGAVVSSQDGVNWISSSVGNSENLNDVYFSGDQVIALGENGGVFTSPDGNVWSKGGIAVDVSLKSISWNQSRYEIVAADGAVLTSLDCKNWNWVLNETAQAGTASGNTADNKTLQGALKLGSGNEDIIWDGKIFITVGLKGGIYTSANGINWTKKNSGTESNLHSVIRTETQYVAVGENGVILTSPDSEKWTSRSSGRYSSKVLNSSGEMGSFKSVVWGKGKFVVVGDSGIILTSPDGEGWTSAIYNNNVDLKKVIWTGKKFVAVGSMGTILLSSDGIKWVKSNTGIFSSVNSIAWNGKIYAAVGESGEILTSSDGVKWTIKNTGVYKSINQIVWDKSSFVAIEGKNSAILVSVNGTTWTRTQYIKDGFISGNEKDVLIITDAENTRDKVKGFGSINQVIWNGTEYIGVGKLTESNVDISKEDGVSLRMGNSVLTSVDGMTWSKGEIGTCRDINSIAWNGERLVAVGDYRTIQHSIPAYIKVLINGTQLTSDIPPVIRNSRTLVPLRAIFETLGLSVGWDEATKTITGTKDDVVITLKVDSADASVNGSAVKLEAPATIVSNRTVVPIRFIAESLGAEINWDNATKTIVIVY